MTYNELMQKPGKRINPKVYYFNDNEKIVKEFDDIKLAKPFFNAKIVGTVMKGLELELTSELPNTAIYFENTVMYGTYSATKTIGPYFLKEKAEYNADSKTYTHKLYDNFITTMIEYKPITIEYPTTVLSFFKQLCLECGFTTNIKTLPNGNRILNRDIYDNINFTYRDVFEDIGQATGTLFKINEDNIEKCLFTSNSVLINDDILKNQNIELSEHFGPINSVVLTRAGGTDSIYKRDESLTKWNEFKISENQLMNDNNRSDYLDELYQALHGIEFDIFDLELTGYGGFEILQNITINTFGRTYNSYVFNNEEKYTQGYEESIYTELPSESETDYSVSDKTDKKINQAYIILNKQEKTLEAVLSEVDETTEKVSKLRLDVDSISESVSKFTNQSETISKLEIDIEKIKSSIGNITDTTTSSQGIGTVEMQKVMNSEILYLQIYPTNRDLSLLYPNDNLYPSDTLYPTCRDLIFQSETDAYIFTLPCDLLFLNNNIKDEFILNHETKEMYKIKRVGIDTDGNKYALVEPQTQYFVYQPFVIEKNGDYSVKMLSFNDAYIYVRTLAQNLLTSQYATKVELNSAIELTKQNIKQEVSGEITLIDGTVKDLSASLELKLNTNDLLSEIALKSNLLTIDADNFKLNVNGNMECFGAKINGEFAQHAYNDFLSVEIKDNAIKFYDWENQGDFSGAVSSTQDKYTKQHGVILYCTQNNNLHLGYDKDPNDGIFDAIFSFDSTKPNQTPWIKNTSSGTLFPNNPSGGITVENGFIKSWNLWSATGTINIQNLAINVVDGLIVSWEVQ